MAISTLLKVYIILMLISMFEIFRLRSRLYPDRYRLFYAALQDRFAVLIGALFTIVSISTTVTRGFVFGAVIGSLLAGYVVTLLAHTLNSRRKGVRR
jgi:hypothetical protein